MLKFKFRRNTHTPEGEYKKEFENTDLAQQAYWNSHINIVHYVSSDKPDSYEKIVREVRRDDTNFHYLADKDFIWEFGRDGGQLLTPEEIALGIVRGIELGFIEVVQE